MNKLSAISEEFTSQGESNVKGKKTGTLVVGEVPAFALPIGAALEFKIGGLLTGNKSTSNDKLQLIPHIPEVGNAAPMTLFDKALPVASNFESKITMSCVEGPDGNPRVEWVIRTKIGKDGSGYGETTVHTNLPVGQQHFFQFFLAHTKSQTNSAVSLKYSYIYSI